MTLTWRTTWTDSDAANVVARFLAMLLIPGFFYFLWYIATPTNGWVINTPQLVGIFLFFPYACIITLVFLFRIFSGGSSQEASLSLTGAEGDAYRLDEKWSLKVVVGAHARVVEFLPQEVECFLREAHDESDGLIYWYRVVLWRKNQTSTILFERVPGNVATEALDWLHAKIGTKPPVS